MTLMQELIAIWHSIKHQKRGLYGTFSAKEQASAVVASGHWTLSRIRELAQEEEDLGITSYGYWSDVWGIVQQARRSDDNWQKTPNGWTCPGANLLKA